MSNKKVCVVGAGYWGKNHIRNLNELDALGGIVEQKKDLLDQISEQYPDAKTYQNLNEALINEEFTGFTVATPAATHHDIAVQIIKSGKHVLVASPLSPSAQTAEDVINACRSANVRLMVSHSLRFMPSQQEVKAALTDGKLGEPGLLRMHRWTESTDQSDADGIMMGQTVDGIDLAIWLFDGMPTEVYAVSRPSYVQVHLGCAGGGMALIDDARTLPSGGEYFSLSLIGSTGAAYADDHHNRNLLFRGGDPSAIETDQGLLHLTAQLQEFAAAIEEQREPAANGADSQAALQVAEAAVASLQSRQALRLIGGTYELV